MSRVSELITYAIFNIIAGIYVIKTDATVVDWTCRKLPASCKLQRATIALLQSVSGSGCSQSVSRRVSSSLVESVSHNSRSWLMKFSRIASVSTDSNFVFAFSRPRSVSQTSCILQKAEKNGTLSYCVTTNSGSAQGLQLNLFKVLCCCFYLR